MVDRGGVPEQALGHRPRHGGLDPARPGARDVEIEFAAAAMGFCNELASRWNCDRTALGVLKGRYVHLKGLSHTEKFSRKMQLAQSIEAAMEECLDQDIEVMHPPDPEAT